MKAHINQHAKGNITLNVEYEYECFGQYIFNQCTNIPYSLRLTFLCSLGVNPVFSVLTSQSFVVFDMFGDSSIISFKSTSTVALIK